LTVVFADFLTSRVDSTGCSDIICFARAAIEKFKTLFLSKTDSREGLITALPELPVFLLILLLLSDMELSDELEAADSATFSAAADVVAAGRFCCGRSRILSFKPIKPSSGICDPIPGPPNAQNANGFGSRPNGRNGIPHPANWALLCASKAKKRKGFFWKKGKKNEEKYSHLKIDHSDKIPYCDSINSKNVKY
jgi:hypothetical protein